MIVIPLSLFVFSRLGQRWAGGRYLILMLPAMALIAAAGLTALARRTGPWVFPVAVLLLASGQLEGLRSRVMLRGVDQNHWDSALPFMRFCQAAGVL